MHLFNAWPLRKRWRCGHKVVTGKMLSTWPSFKTSNNHLGAEKLSCLSILHCTIKKNDIKFTNEKKNSKKSVAKLFFTTNHNPTAEVEHRVSRALQNIDLKQNIVFIEAWSTDPIRSTGSAERILDFWISGISTQPGNSQIRILFPNDAKGWKSKKSRLDQLSKHMQQGSLILSFETSEWYYDLPLWLVTV